jgi:hypothetical protein
MNENQNKGEKSLGEIHLFFVVILFLVDVFSNHLLWVDVIDNPLYLSVSRSTL